MVKKIMGTALAFMLVFALLIPTVSFAAYGNTMPLGATGSRGDLVYIKRPESHNASTSDKTYTISAAGASGTKVKIYKYSPSSGTCTLVKGETTIGASGLYSTVVNLNDNSNIFMVYAYNDSGDQVVRIDINKIKKSTVDKLKGITVTIKNFLK